MAIAESLIQEIEQEAAATRRLLERVPGDRLDWRPHDKSMSLGQLAHHVATIPGNIAELASQESIDAPDFANFPSCESAEALLAAFDESLQKARDVLPTIPGEMLSTDLHVVRDGQTLMSMPRMGVLRSIMLNHWYHHRGQLTVYLRLLEVPLPATYGASADENPFNG